MRRFFNYWLSLAWNFILVLLVYILCRVVFFLMNHDVFASVTLGELWHLYIAGGWRFDLTAAIYTNLPYIVLILLPFGFRRTRFFRKLAKWVYIVPNMLLFSADLADGAYFPFTGERTTFSVFREFSNDNVTGILLKETLVHWYLVLVAVAILFLLIKGYREPAQYEKRYNWLDYIVHTLLLAATIVMAVFGIRGKFTFLETPLDINDANLIINHQEEASLVLNTPFCLFRTIGKATLPEPHWFPDQESLEKVFNPIHQPAGEGEMVNKKNVVIFILESFSASYSGYLTSLQGTPQPTYMPFLDSLMQHSLHCRYSYASGRISIDAQPAIMCGIPMLYSSFAVSAHANNEVQGLASELKQKGYQSAFYHGAERKSLGICSFAVKSGFDQVYSLEDYGDRSRADGFGGVLDEYFIPYFREGIGHMQEPFLATIFTLTSHHPYVIPSCYDDVYEAGTMPIHRTIRYVDDQIRKFFLAAREEPWFQNTVFIFTGDHTNQTDNPEYKSLNGGFSIPIFFYAPDGSMPAGLRDATGMQMSIKPTLYHYLGYDQPYFSFGCDLLGTADEDTYALYYQSGTFMLCQQGYQLQFDGEKPVALFHYSQEPMAQTNVMDQEPERVAAMEEKLKAMIQQYTQRMTSNAMVVR